MARVITTTPFEYYEATIKVDAFEYDIAFSSEPSLMDIIEVMFKEAQRAR